MAKVTGVGGVFFKSKGDHKALAAWYQKHLGMPVESWGGAALKWPDDKAEDNGVTAWHVAARDTTWFAPSEAPFMINYRVENLEALVEELKKDGVTICDEIASYDYGKFVHILDAEGNKIELWEPKD